ncbi:MAG: hypothetical protein KAW52_05195 [candidate division Zixibacteria bacterium]|nr:hypothetical protein [candidate division Zixibacteria bacterium]
MNPLKIDTGKPKAKCEYCGEEFEQTRPDKRFCCPEHQKAATKTRKKQRNKPEYHKHYVEELRKQAFAILGNQCQRCEETDHIVLCIDHLIPVLGKTRRLTVSIYYEIIRHPENAKEKYQLLCRNCNWRKRIENNEGKQKEKIYAYALDVEALTERVRLLEKKLPKIRRISRIQTTKKEITKTEIVEEDLEQMLEPYITDLISEKTGRLSISKMRLLLREKEKISISTWKAYQIKGNMEAEHPELFDDS